MSGNGCERRNEFERRINEGLKSKLRAVQEERDW